MKAIAEKGISLVIFFLITIVAGSIPIVLFARCQGRMSSRRGQTIISLLNCFAGGVFFATCILNLLVEGFEEYEDYRTEAKFDNEYPFFHLGIAVGFFAVALVERFAVIMSRDRAKRKRDEAREERSRKTSIACSSIVVNTESSSWAQNGAYSPSPDDIQPVTLSEETTQSEKASPPNSQSSTVFVVSDSEVDTSPNGWHKSVSEHRKSGEEEEGEHRFTGRSGVIVIAILLALSFHTIFDGLAVGLQETEANIWTTTAAISVHKTIVAVSLGLELAANSPTKPLRAFSFLFLFALMAPLGVAIGMGVTSGNVDNLAHLLTGSILQAVATGSFMYVTFFEVLGMEMGHRSSLMKIFMTALGFAFMAVAKIWDTD